MSVFFFCVCVCDSSHLFVLLMLIGPQMLMTGTVSMVLFLSTPVVLYPDSQDCNDRFHYLLSKLRIGCYQRHTKKAFTYDGS